MNETQYWLWFASINILPIKKIRLLKEFKEIERIYKANQIELLKAKDIDFIDIAEIEKNKRFDLIKKYEDYINKNEIKVININDKLYPEKLRQIYDPPVVLFAKGNIKLLNEKGIAIVGSREASEYGLKQAYHLSFDLAKNGVTVISGLAKGIDAMGHFGALNAKGNTIAVIGSGLDIIYPNENKNLYKKIFDEGLVISEFIVGKKPLPQNFPMRNRIISALSDGVLMVQAKEKSGAMITVDFALEQGKNVYAVPRKH